MFVHSDSRRRHLAPLGLALAACLLTGCGADTAPDGAPLQDLPVWTTGSETVRIGAVDDPAYAYGPVQDLALDASGRPHSVHRQEAQVRRWTTDGRPDLIIGRQGEGPGEFTEVRGMGFFGDTLWVMDGRAYRITFFDGQGSVLGTHTPQVDLGTVETHANPPARPATPLRSGGIYGRAPAWSEEIAKGELTRSLHAHLSPDGQTRDTIYWQPHSPQDLLALLNPEGGGTFAPQPFPDDVVAQVDPAGERLLVLERRAWSGTGAAAFTVTALDVSGDTLWHRAIPYEPLPLPGAAIDSIIAERAGSMYEFLSRFREGVSREGLEADMLAATYRPAYVPPVKSMLVGVDGGVWLALGDAPGSDDQTWLVLDAAGEPLARVQTPAGLRVMAADRTQVWGVVRDELDVDYIVRHPLLGG